MGHRRYHIEGMDRLHAPQAASVLRSALPDSLLVGLGQGFLRELLDSYASFEGGCAHVALHDGRVVGFVVGTEDSGHHRRLLIRQRWASLCLQVARGVVQSPRALGQLGRYLLSYLPLLWPGNLRNSSSDEDGSLPPASLVLLCVDPAHHRRGIAMDLTDAFLADLAGRGVRQAKAVVGASNEPALSFFMAGGWRTAGRFGTYDGRAAYRLIRETTLRAAQPA